MQRFSRSNYFADIEPFVVNQQIIRILSFPKHQFIYDHWIRHWDIICESCCI
jgi:hypothetical protein